MSTTESFSAVVLDARGRISTQRFEASNADQARQLAAALGHTVIECAAERTSTARDFKLLAGIGQRRALDPLAFAQDLSTLLQAGVTVRESVEVLQRRKTMSSGRQVLSRVADLMSQGHRFSDALSRSEAFPPLLVATVAASEQTGDLSVGLSRYAKHQQSLRVVRDRVVGACIYPALLLGVGSCVILVLLGIVIPRFARLLDSQNRDLPLLSKALMAWGQLADAHPILPIGMFAAFFAFLFFLFIRLKDGDRRKSLLSKIPGVARVVREFQHLQLYRTTAILTSRGINIHRALVFGMNLLSPADRQRLQSGLQQMNEGIPMSRALSGCGFSDEIATSMLNVAERSGALSEMLDRIADFYEASLQRGIEIASRLIEPVLMIILGIVIGGIVILMYLPIFDLASSIS